jgi:hypothetical protein
VLIPRNARNGEAIIAGLGPSTPRQLGTEGLGTRNASQEYTASQAKIVSVFRDFTTNIVSRLASSVLRV